MQTLLSLLEYNAWANERMFALCRTVDPALLADTAGGTVGSVERTLKHLVAVEDVYLARLDDRDLEAALEPQEVYMAHDLTWFGHRSAELAEGYRTLLASHDQSWLDGRMQMPWFDFAMTKRDGVLQAVTHSAQHRAQVFSILGMHGAQVPDVDYVFMVGERSAAG